MAGPFPSFEQRRAAEEQAIQEVRDQLKGRSHEEVLAHTRSYHSDYQKLLEECRRTEGNVCYDHILKSLEDAYPDAASEKRTEMAFRISRMIREELGETKSVPQDRVVAAVARRDTAVEELAKLFTPEEIEDLEQQARLNMQEDQFPENFDEYKRIWLSEWVAKGVLQYTIRA